jgi:hypothetical protein
MEFEWKINQATMKMPKRFKQIRIGQSADEVVRLIGVPEQVVALAHGTLWRYFSGCCEIVLSGGENPVVVKVIVLST